MMQRIRFLVAALLILSVIGGGLFWYQQRPAVEKGLVLYGNVDFRQASVPFNGTERIAEVLVEEGDVIKKGQVLARLDTSRLLPQLAQVEATLESQKAVLERLHNGSRPEEVAQAKANLESAKADAANTQAQYGRLKTLASISAVSVQDIDQARAAANKAKAKVDVESNALKLALIGPRKEDIDQASAQLHSYEAQRALLRQQVADAELIAPFDALVQSRLMEPGEMASPNKPVFSLASLGTKWVRAYVSEPNLGSIHSGARADIKVDTLPNTSLSGWVGFISSVAEFTPKTVQTEDLRASLVYEVRVFVEDAENRLRLGMPATVVILPDTSMTPEAPPQ